MKIGTNLVRAGRVSTALMAAVLLAAAGCSNQVESNIDKLASGGADAEAAKMALSMARGEAVEPLMAAFADRQYRAKSRAAMADALFRLYLREKDKRILDLLQSALGDEAVPVRRVAVRALGDLRTTDAAGAILGQLANESDDGVRQEILVTLNMMGRQEQPMMSPTLDFRARVDMLTEEEQEQFVRILQGMRQEGVPDALMQKTMDWLESIAEGYIVEAQRLLVEADLAGAEELLATACELVPDSKNANQRLGKFYFENGEREKGLEILRGIGAAIDIPRLSRAPKLDGVVDDAVWQEVAPITDFYQNISQMRAFTIKGESRAYVGHRDGVLYIGIRGYEPSTHDLTAAAQDRDDLAYQDDCVEVFFDANLDSRTYHQYVINSIGTIMDQYNNGESRGGDLGWNGALESAQYLGEDFWSIELAIPLGQFGVPAPSTGDVWGANIARIRITHASEYGQWVPTYGSALRPDRFGYLVFQ